LPPPRETRTFSNVASATIPTFPFRRVLPGC
jgi:hypothetical protein